MCGQVSHLRPVAPKALCLPGLMLPLSLQRFLSTKRRPAAAHVNGYDDVVWVQESSRNPSKLNICLDPSLSPFGFCQKDDSSAKQEEGLSGKKKRKKKKNKAKGSDEEANLEEPTIYQEPPKFEVRCVKCCGLSFSQLSSKIIVWFMKNDD